MPRDEPGTARGGAETTRGGASRAGVTHVIDAGSIVGAVGGGSLGVVISGNFDDHTTLALAVVGLGAAAYFTRDWNEGRASTILDDVYAARR